VSHRGRFSLVVGCHLLLGLAATAGTPAYQVKVLPVPDGCVSFSQWHGLAQSGDAAGIILCEGEYVPKAVRWGPTGMTELPTLGGPSATPFGIGRNGVVVGFAETPEMYDSESHVQRPVIWEGVVARDLGTLGGPLGAATAINSSGLIVGTSQLPTVDPLLERRPLRACAWEAGSIRDLGDLGGPEASAYDVNERGSIVGSSTTTIFLPSGLALEEHAFLFDGRSMRDLGTLGGRFSLAYAINSKGDVVGISTPPTPPSSRSSWHAFIWAKDAMRDLGTLGGPYSAAFDINNRGDVVGWSQTSQDSDFSQHAVLWRGNQPLDLNDLVSGAAPDCVLTSATAITERGNILADMQCGGRPRVVILDPVDDDGR
jgi:probable HAF family extracellular repeat protein